MKKISLISNSGIQFYQTKVNLTLNSKVSNPSFSFCEYVEKDSSGNEDVRFVIPYFWSAENTWIEKAPGVDFDFAVNAEAINKHTWEITDEAKINRNFVKSIAEDKIQKASLTESLQIFEGEWLPIPYFKLIDEGRFHSGPSSWARIWINKIPVIENTDGEHTHNVVIAFDTNIFKDQPDYFTPDAIDADAAALFSCAVDDKNLTFFNSSQWVTEWLEKVYSKRVKRKEDIYFKYLALYFVFIKSLSNSEAFPVVSYRSKGQLAIEASLILDVGNSRTCGILVETDIPGEPFQINNAKSIVLRDLTNPDRTYSDPFEMKLAFVKQTFGFESAGALAGHDNSFMWPSLVRVGAEAVRLSSVYENLNNTSMSSPKKYLWDKNKRLFHWNYISDHGSEQPAMFGIGKLFTQEGELKSIVEKNQNNLSQPNKAPIINALNAYYSRSSLMTFALIEIILQAISYANSYEYRSKRGENMPTEFMTRKIKRLVLTCPTAMLETEKRIFREHARDAVLALKLYFNDEFIDEDLEIIPDVEDLKKTPENRKNWGYDEATSSQLSFLYGEIVGKFQNKHVPYFEYLGKIRKNNSRPNEPSVMIASVDIGGGTTDLMICNYESNPDAHSTVLRPDPQFWEGFNIAGDTIVKSVIERLILPVIRAEMESKGCNSNSCFPFLFGPHLGLMNIEDKMRRKQFAYEIANCLAVEFLKHATHEKDDTKKAFNDFFIYSPAPHPDLIAYINEKVNNTYGGKNFNIKNIVFNLNSQSINQVVKDVTEKMLRDLCGVISKYDCDYLLLAGRPTTLPVIKELFLKYLPIMPDRIVPLGNYKAGAWYPFANEQGIIKDPKTSVVVGASVALLAGTLNRLGTFSIDTSLLTEKFESTANYVGRFKPHAQQVDEIYFSEKSNEKEILFFGELLIGMKQIPKDDWIGSMMYKLVFTSNALAQEYNKRLPLTVILVRDEINKETITISGNITDKFGGTVNKNVLTLYLQTIADDTGHWLDTGIFSV